jgi:hypothetical protein
MSKDRPGRYGAHDDDAFITRGELCKALGIGKTTLRRWEEKGKARPITNANGVKLYPREEAERLTGGVRIAPLPKARALVPNAASSDAEVAAQIFERLDREVHPVDIVKELRVHPDIVEGFVARWQRMRKTIMLTGTDVTALAKVLRCEVGDARALLSAIQTLAGRARVRCEDCEGTRPTMCGKCVEAHLRAAVRRTERRMAHGAESSAIASGGRHASSVGRNHSARLPRSERVAAEAFETLQPTTSEVKLPPVVGSPAPAPSRTDGVVSEENGGAQHEGATVRNG